MMVAWTGVVQGVGRSGRKWGLAEEVGLCVYSGYDMKDVLTD